MKKTLSLIFLVFTLSNNYSYASEEKEVEKFIQNVGDKVIEITSNPKITPDDKSNKIIELVDNSIDANWIARFVLGNNYKTASEPQRQRFQDLYRQFMINTYGPKFKNYEGTGFKVKQISKESRFYLVKTDFLTKKIEAPIAIDFRVRKLNNRLVILDFIAEGISLIETQRSEFNSAIAKNGMDKFLDELEIRVKKLKNGK